MKRIYSALLLVSILLLSACEPGLHGDIRARETSIAVRNTDPGTWTNVMFELDGEYKLEIDSLPKDADTVLMFSDFENQTGQTYDVRGTRPQTLSIYAGQGMLTKRWK